MADKNRVGWYWKRLRDMSVSDIVGRAGSTAAQVVGRYRGAVPVPPFRLDRTGARWLLPEVSAEGDFMGVADEVMSGHWRVLALDQAPLGLPPDWNCNPLDGEHFPLNDGRTLSRREDGSGDIKYLWTLNRHRELVSLGLAWRKTGCRDYLDAIGVLMSDWLEKSPYPHGPNWSSAVEVALRLMNWATVWQLIGGPNSALFAEPVGKVLRSDWLGSVWRHAEFIQAHLSRPASAGSDRLGELAGLYVAGATWPYWSQAKVWRATGRDGLEQEVPRQISADGVVLEHSMAAQRMTWDVLSIAALAARATGREFSHALGCRLEAMAEYVAAVMDTGGNVPQFGDSDDGDALGLGQAAGGCAYRSMLATGALLFSRPAFARKAGMLDPRTRWLMGVDAARQFNLLLLKAFPSTLRTAFPEGGVYVLGAHLDTPLEWRIVADAGALGAGAMAEHGHADALSFTLSVSGREFLVDPGSGTYHGQRAWRDAFRSTALHNTLVIGSEDQAVSGGRFLWKRKYAVSVIRWESDADGDVLVAEHDGYRRLSGKPVHRRTWSFDRKTDSLSVRDEVIATMPQLVTLCWHFGEDCLVARSTKGVAVHNGPVRVDMVLPSGGDVSILQASEQPFAGWISRTYDRRVPATTVTWRGTLSPGDVLETEFRKG